MKKLGNQLKKYRIREYKKTGLRKVAKDIGINYSYLYRVEKGVHIPSDDMIDKMRIAYHMTYQEAFTLMLTTKSKAFTNLIRYIDLTI